MDGGREVGVTSGVGAGLVEGLGEALALALTRALALTLGLRDTDTLTLLEPVSPRVWGRQKRKSSRRHAAAGQGAIAESIRRAA